MKETQQIVFVYNAGSTIFSMSADYLHKLFSPATYQCSLCLLTYGNFGMKRDWKRFIQQLPVPVSFLYKDVFIQQNPQLSATLFPAAFISDGQQLSVLLTADEIKRLNSVQALAHALQVKLAAL